jgi:hypothetical protein
MLKIQTVWKRYLWAEFMDIITQFLLLHYQGVSTGYCQRALVGE